MSGIADGRPGMVVDVELESAPESEKKRRKSPISQKCNGIDIKRRVEVVAANNTC